MESQKQGREMKGTGAGESSILNSVVKETRKVVFSKVIASMGARVMARAL